MRLVLASYSSSGAEMRARRLVVVLTVSAAMLLFATTARAQRTNFQSGTTTNTLFGQQTIGGNGQSQTGSSSQGSQSAQVGSASSVDTTNVALRNMTTRPQVETQQQRGAFVGADSSDTVHARSLQALQGGGGSRTAASGLAQLQNLFSQGLQNINRNNQQGSQPQIRVSLKMGFTPRPVSTAQIKTFETRLTKLPALRFVGQPELTLEGRTAVLRGKVASEDDRQLAEALVRMEPAVLDVRNELVVDASATTATAEAQSPSASSP
jgi:hypothetical protein